MAGQTPARHVIYSVACLLALLSTPAKEECLEHVYMGFYLIPTGLMFPFRKRVARAYQYEMIHSSHLGLPLTPLIRSI